MKSDNYEGFDDYEDEYQDDFDDYQRKNTKSLLRNLVEKERVNARKKIAAKTTVTIFDYGYEDEVEEEDRICRPWRNGLLGSNKSRRSTANHAAQHEERDREVDQSSKVVGFN